MKLPHLILLAMLLAAPASAQANGRFPASTQLVVHPNDPQKILIRVTFGLLLSHDGGQTFDWVCERFVGYGGTQDPAVALTSAGVILVAAFEGLANSFDQGCSFSFVGITQKEFIIDVAVDRQNPASAVAVSSTGMGNQTFHVQVVETVDSGKTWKFIGTPLDPELLAETIDPAPSRPQRLYVSGFSSTFQDGTQTRHGALYASDDRGHTWQRHEIDLAGDKSVYIAAVDPKDPERVYVRTRGIEKDRLLRTDDGGKTFTVLTTVPGSMLGFALSPDGSLVAVGGPSAGVLVADTSELTFTKTNSAEVACLTWTNQGLYACGNPFKDGFVLGRSSDEGQTFTPVLASFQSLRGPLSTCIMDPTPATTCAEEWGRFKLDFGIEDGAAGAAGSVGVSPGGGPTAGQGSAGATGGSAMARSDDSSSCGCASPGHSPVGAGVATLVGLLGLLAVRRNKDDA
ncbi:MAG: hypothetical protein MUF64_08315 [Polyangiaceae bacterium]|jgi:hypothetical protein|nr:hypothetical protein [Polyangiaceae bacterium]